MPSTAQSAQQAKLRVNTASGTPLVITGVTAASPPVVSFTPGADPADGTIIQIDGIVGMTELNGRSYVTDSLSAGVSFELKGADSTLYTAYASAGTATPKTMTDVGNVKTFDIQQDEATEIDVTNLDSVRKEFQIGLAGSWTSTSDYDIDSSDTGQAEFEAAQNDGLSRVFSITLNSGSVFTGIAFVKSTSATGSPDAVVSGTVSLRGTGQPSWFV